MMMSVLCSDAFLWGRWGACVHIFFSSFLFPYFRTLLLLLLFFCVCRHGPSSRHQECQPLLVFFFFPSPLARPFCLRLVIESMRGAKQQQLTGGILWHCVSIGPKQTSSFIYILYKYTWSLKAKKEKKDFLLGPSSCCGVVDVVKTPSRRVSLWVGEWLPAWAFGQRGRAKINKTNINKQTNHRPPTSLLLLLLGLRCV